MTNQEAIEDIRDNIKPIVGGKSLDMAIEALEERKTGRWLRTGEVDVYYDLPSYECSKCGKTSLENGDYCPFCGAKMEGNA